MTEQEIEQGNTDSSEEPKKRSSFIEIFISNTALFYYCALISSWDDRSWYFLVGIYLVILDPTNFILTAIFGFLSSAVILLFGSFIGSLIDRTSRLKAAYIALTIRNVSILICSISLGLVLFLKYDLTRTDQFSKLLFMGRINLIIFGIIANVAGMANNNMLHKDWLPILCAKDSQLLSTMNSRFRLIDLTSKIVAPIIIGQIITFAGKPIAAMVFSFQVLSTLLIFAVLLRIIYRRMPRLHYKEDLTEQSAPIDELSPINDNYNSLKEEPKETKNNILSKCIIFIEGWLVYLRQSIMFAGLGLALLYMTVLGFDSVTIGYAISQGMSESTLSFFNAGAALTGILGALIFPYVLRITNIIFIGLIALSLQLLGLIPCVISIWAPGSPFDLFGNSTNIANNSSFQSFTISPYAGNAWSLSLLMLMSGIVASRTGLWMYDLTISQLLVETVLEINRGKVNGVQNSLNMLFDMIKFALVLGLPLPRQFGLLIIFSVGAVSTGNLCYIIFAIKSKCKVKSYL